jgi:hypothetical protein
MGARRHHVIAAAAIALAAAAVPASAQVARPLPGGPAVIVVPGTTVIVPAVPIEHFGAIAFQPATGAFGYSYDWTSAREAEVSALDECGDARCIVLVTFSDGCGALAVGARGAFAERGATRAEAETRALVACADPASCQLRAWACTR